MFINPQGDFGYFELLTKGIYLEKINSHSKDLYKFQVDSSGIYLECQKVSKFNWTKVNDPDKPRSNNKIQISNIKEIRRGAQTDVFSDVFKGLKKESMESLCCSLLLFDGKTINLRANREDVRDAFIEGMSYLKNRQIRNLWYREQFSEADINNDSVLSRKEIVRLLRRLNIDVDELYVTSKESLNLDEFIELIRKFQSRKIIVELFQKYAGTKDSLSVEDLHKIFVDEQHSTLDTMKCEGIVNSFEVCPEYRLKKLLTLDGFHQLFNSEWFDILSTDCSGVYQDMNQPLTHYFIDSSHNTYLEGDQINSYSRVECYINVLRTGCRCVEIDVWDGNENGPVVTHGHAGTTKLLFSDVISAVDKYAFEKSKYPVILSLENHCNLEKQKKMAKIMKDIFKDKLFIGPVKDEADVTPENLRGRIIIKGKKLEGLKSSSSMEADDISTDFDNIDGKAKPAKVAQEMSDLVVICQPAKFSSFHHSEINHNFRNVCSLDENTAKNLFEQDLKGFIVHNMRIMSRIYPSGIRIKSSNYDPVIYWLAGCQLVALNHQTPTRPMFLNRGMFSDNGECGYILKPEHQRNLNKLEEFSTPRLLQMRKHYFITILDGFMLPKKPKDSTSSILDPYISVNIFGIPEDNNHFKTEIIKNNGFNPIWNFQFSFCLQNPELALILFEVHDYEKIGSDVVVAQCCFRAGMMMPGYRIIHLKSVGGEKLQSNLMVHILIK